MMVTFVRLAVVVVSVCLSHLSSLSLLPPPPTSTSTRVAPYSTMNFEKSTTLRIVAVALSTTLARNLFMGQKNGLAAWPSSPRLRFFSTPPAATLNDTLAVSQGKALLPTRLEPPLPASPRLAPKLRLVVVEDSAPTVVGKADDAEPSLDLRSNVDSHLLFGPDSWELPWVEICSEGRHPSPYLVDVCFENPSSANGTSIISAHTAPLIPATASPDIIGHKNTSSKSVHAHLSVIDCLSTLPCSSLIKKIISKTSRFFANISINSYSGLVTLATSIFAAAVFTISILMVRRYSIFSFLISRTLCELVRVYYWLKYSL